MKTIKGMLEPAYDAILEGYSTELSDGDKKLLAHLIFENKIRVAGIWTINTNNLGMYPILCYRDDPFGIRLVEIERYVFYDKDDDKDKVIYRAKAMGKTTNSTYGITRIETSQDLEYLKKRFDEFLKENGYYLL